MGSITFMGSVAPQISSSSFGVDSGTWIGKNASQRIVYVPTNSTGYESDSWNNTIFDKNRIIVNSDETITECYFVLSKTL